MGRVTPEIMAMFDGACRAKNPEEAGAHVKKVAQECQHHDEVQSLCATIKEHEAAIAKCHKLNTESG